MRAIILHGPRRITLEDVPVPAIAADEVLVKIAVATTCGTDLKVYEQGGHPRMLRPPTPFGHEWSGTLAAVGSRVRGFREGMRVVANNSAPCLQCFYCRRQLFNLCEDLLFVNGAFAEYLVLPARLVQTNLLVVPEGLPLALACLTEPLACVLHCLDQVTLHPGDTVVINGDGPHGLLLAAVAKRRGARVILCGRAPQRLALAPRFGADAVVNYAAVPDQAAAVRALTEGQRGADVAIEAVGRPQVWEATAAMVRKGGQVVFYGGCPPHTRACFDTQALHYDQLTLRGVFHNTPAHVRQALALLGEADFPAAALLTHTLPLSELATAFALMASRQALKVALQP
ncbi:MAG: dehydrogenase [Candidatus Tectimicrobiota bacterium]|nr:MAG: dehydrogenase [Candidatus Tectomicrobia bacterium]